jgi:hypothetical protein
MSDKVAVGVDATPEEVLQALDKDTSKQGLLELRNALEEILYKQKIALAGMQGKVAGYTDILRIVDTLAQRLHGVGIESELEENQAVADAKAEVEETEIQKEVRRRLEEGKCTYKHPKHAATTMAGKWCQRPIESDVGKKRGYCNMCLEDLGITE